MTNEAVVLTIDWEDERVYWTFFANEAHADAFKEAEQERGDFPPPRYSWRIAKTEAGKDKQADRFLQALGIKP